jgi:hypothetical protein
MVASQTAGRQVSRQISESIDTRHGGLFYDLVSYDTIIRNGRWFDGTGAPSAVRNLGLI